MGYKLWLAIALVIVIILFLASIIEYIPSINGEPDRLSIVWQRTPEATLPCTGELTLTSQNLGNGKCTLKADSVLTNCKKTTWTVYEGNECSGTYICNGYDDQPVSIWRCSWDVDPGTYTFTLCADSVAKATRSISC
jgi:hypothetical protein